MENTLHLEVDDGVYRAIKFEGGADTGVILSHLPHGGGRVLRWRNANTSYTSSPDRYVRVDGRSVSKAGGGVGAILNTDRHRNEVSGRRSPNGDLQQPNSSGDRCSSSGSSGEAEQVEKVSCADDFCDECG